MGKIILTWIEFVHLVCDLFIHKVYPSIGSLIILDWQVIRIVITILRAHLHSSLCKKNFLIKAYIVLICSQNKKSTILIHLQHTSNPGSWLSVITMIDSCFCWWLARLANQNPLNCFPWSALDQQLIKHSHAIVVWCQSRCSEQLSKAEGVCT